MFVSLSPVINTPMILAIEPHAHRDMHLVEFGEDNTNIANGPANNSNRVGNNNASKNEANDSEMGD